MPEVTTSQWALLVRAAGDKPVALAKVIETFMLWFSPVLSSAEIEKAMDHCIDQGWIETVRSEEGDLDLHTTSLGQAAIDAVQRPLLLAGLFGMANRKGVLDELSAIPALFGSVSPPSTGSDPAKDDRHEGT